MVRQRGFTLVELLVVITILSLLFVVLLQGIAGAQSTADEFACRARLKNLYGAIQQVKARNQGKLPAGGGTDFFYSIWNHLEHTEKNRDLFFCPEVSSVFEREIEARDPREIWKSREDFTSEDTDYAALAKEHRRLITNGNQVIIADANQDGSNHQTGTVNALYGDGTIKPFTVADFRDMGVWNDEDPDYHIRVGADSQVEAFQKLSKN